MRDVVSIVQNIEGCADRYVQDGCVCVWGGGGGAQARPAEIRS